MIAQPKTNSTTVPSPHRLVDLSIALSAAFLVFLTLFVVIAYASGYGAERVSILSFANAIWKNGEDWQHCYLIPFAVAGIIYYERKKFADLPVSFSWVGLALTIFGFFVYWVGYRADNIYIGYASFQLLTSGFILWLFGWKWMLALWFPWVLLVFLYPLPFLDNFVAFPLRLIMSEASAHALNIIGVPAIKSGTAIISAPDAVANLRAGALFSVDVADPCSGIRSLFALMMVSALYSYLTQKSLWKGIFLFACSIPLAVTGNLVRILMLTFGTIIMGPEKAIGTLEEPTLFHLIAGYVVFVVALGGLLGISWLLNADWRSIFQQLKQIDHPKVPPPGASGQKANQPAQDDY